MEDPLPGSIDLMPLATLAPGVLWTLAATLLVVGILLRIGQSAIEHFSWKKLHERIASERRRAAYSAWLDGDGDEHAARALEWFRLAAFLMWIACLERLLFSGLDWLPWMSAFLGCALTLMVIGEAIPNLIGRYNAESILVTLGPLLRAITAIAAPIARAMRWLPTAVARLSGANPETFEQDQIQAEISDAAEEGERTGVLEGVEREMIENIIDLGQTEAAEVMTPRIDVVSIDVGATLDAARTIATESGYSRLPVFEGNRDQIIGILHVKDLLNPNPGESVRSLSRKPMFIPESKRVGELLHELRHTESHVAIVLDEYGGTSGLITMEDILEEIVGEIRDEFDKAEDAPIREIAPNTLRVDAKVPVYDLNASYPLHLPDDQGYETLGGFVFSTLGRVPETGEQFRHNGAEFTIVDADTRRVNTVQITVGPEQTPADAG